MTNKIRVDDVAGGFSSGNTKILSESTNHFVTITPSAGTEYLTDIGVTNASFGADGIFGPFKGAFGFNWNNVENQVTIDLSAGFFAYVDYSFAMDFDDFVVRTTDKDFGVAFGLGGQADLVVASIALGVETSVSYQNGLGATGVAGVGPAVLTGSVFSGWSGYLGSIFSTGVAPTTDTATYIQLGQTYGVPAPVFSDYPIDLINSGPRWDTPPTHAHNTDKLKVAGPVDTSIPPSKPDLVKGQIDSFPAVVARPSGSNTQKAKAAPINPIKDQRTPAQVSADNRDKRQKKAGNIISFWNDRFQISRAFQSSINTKSMQRISLLIFLSFSATEVAAQETECVTKQQYLRGEFTAKSKPCDEALQTPISFCSPEPLSQDRRLALRLREGYQSYLVPSWPESLEEAISFSDLLRFVAVSDETISESSSGLFLYLFSSLLSAQINELFEEYDGEKPTSLFAGQELQRQYFPFGVNGTADFYQRAIECVVRCGNEAIKPELLTRSAVFQMCLGENQ